MIIRATLEPEKAQAENRSSGRKTLRLATLGARLSRESEEVLVHDLSAGGLLIESAAAFEVGETLKVDLPHSGQNEAVVVWSSTNFYGCRFAKPLTPAAMSAALLKAFPPSDSAAAPRSVDETASLPERLTALRRARGKTMEQLAADLGVSRQSVWYWEAGKRRPKPATLSRIARQFGVSEQDLTPLPPRNALTLDDMQLLKARLAERFGVAPENVKILVEL